MSIRTRTLASLFAVASASVLAGCGGPQWVIHSQAAPDPFLNQRNFSVLPADFTGYLIGGKSEAEYLSSKNPEQQAGFQSDKQGIDEAFANSLAGHAQGSGITVARATGPEGAPFQIHPLIQWLEPGYYAAVAARPAELRMVVRVTSPDGKVIDEIEVHEKGKGLATGLRLRKAADNLGEDVAAYLATRVTGVAK